MKKILVFTVMLGSGLSFAADDRFGYRGVRLGYSAAQVEAASKKTFELTRPAIFFSKTQASVVAGDIEGVKNQECLVGQSLNKPDCHAAWFILNSVDNAAPSLVFISVDQRFSSPIPMQDFLQKINKAYGSPRHSFSAPGNIVDNRELRETTLVWGGEKPVPKDFRFEATYAQEVMRILGGTYANMLVISDGPLVIGYRLQIANSDTWGKSNAQEALRREEEAKRARKAVIDGVNF